MCVRKVGCDKLNLDLKCRHICRSVLFFFCRSVFLLAVMASAPPPAQPMARDELLERLSSFAREEDPEAFYEIDW